VEEGEVEKGRFVPVQHVEEGGMKHLRWSDCDYGYGCDCGWWRGNVSGDRGGIRAMICVVIGFGWRVCSLFEG